MKCPECGNELHCQNVSGQNVSGIVLDECAGCGGTWFDRDELRKSKDIADPDLNWVDVDLWSDQNKFVHQPGTRACPRCETGMSVVRYGESPVHIECCESCHGIWLNRGKFGQLIEALEQEVNAKSLGDMWRATLGEAKQLISGKESLASEWKDFTTVLRMLEYRFLAAHPKLHDTLTMAQKTNPLK